MIEKKNKLRELADKIIVEDEWFQLETRQYNTEDIVIYNYFTKKGLRISSNDTKETLSKKMAELSKPIIED